MEVSYRRHFSKSYMILKSENEPENVLELRILAYNRIPCLLPVETEIADGVLRFWYDITGKQTLGDYLRHRQVDEQLLNLLLSGIEQVCREMWVHLLEEEYLVLDAEYLYLDFEQKHLEFVYLPGERRNLRAAFLSLMEFILQRLEHSDKPAVTAAYEVYQRSLQQDAALGDIVRQDIQKETQTKEQERKEPVPEREKASASSVQTFQEESARDWGWLRQRLFHKEKKESETVSETVCPVPEESGVCHPTELLKEDRKEQGILVYQGEEGQEDLKIDRPVFLIGKKEGEVDGYIGNKTVSRMHARIEENEGSYYMEDLNSTNGTYLNDERLEYRQKVRLKAGDRVAFGMAEYIFR